MKIAGNKMLLIALALLALVLAGALIGVSGQSSPQFISERQSLPEQRPSTKLSAEPRPGQFWLGSEVSGPQVGAKELLVPVSGATTNPGPGRYLLYVDRDYAAALQGGSGPSRPIPLSVNTYRGDLTAGFSDLYGVGRFGAANGRPITYSANGLMAWLYDPGSEQTVVVIAWSPEALFSALKRLQPA